MATVNLGRSEEWFWNTSPRVLLTLIDQYWQIEGTKNSRLLYQLNGGKLDELQGSTVQKETAFVEFM